MLGLAVSDINYEKYFYGHSPATTTTLFEYIKPGPIVCNLLKIIVYYVKINKYLELSVAMRNLWCLEKISILPLVISATGTVPQSLFKNLKILDLDNTLVVEIQKGILLYSCHIVRKFLNIDTEHNTQQSQNAEARRR
jgi:hypothetical protein